jgi:hypothetical protein
MPLLLLVAFEQSYVIHKRKTAKFCCIGFDRGHRLKNTDGLKCVSRLLRYSMWFISAGLLVFNCVMNARVIESTRGGSNAYLLKQRRFTTKGMLQSSSTAAGGGGMNPQAGDLVEYVIVVTFTFYFGLSLWNYGKNFSMKMTAMPCNRWMAMLFGSLQLLILSLLPDTFTVFTADLSVVLYMLTMILLQREVLLDLTKLMDYDKNSKREDAAGGSVDSTGISLGGMEGGGGGGGTRNGSGIHSLPSWALGNAMTELASATRAEVNLIEEMEKNNRHPFANPMRSGGGGGGGGGESKSAATGDRPRIKPPGEVGLGAIARLKAMHAKNVKFRPLAPNYVAALAKAQEGGDSKTGEATAAE